jgi:hypothetical protein
MNHPASRPGYVFLISVLVVGVIASAVTVSLLLLGGAAERTAYSLQESVQAFENAQTCIERGLLALRADLNYAGGETVTLARGTCALRAIGGSGNLPRMLCAEGRSGLSVRRVEVKTIRIFPAVLVDTWHEVPSFTFCP